MSLDPVTVEESLETEDMDCRRSRVLLKGTSLESADRVPSRIFLALARIDRISSDIGELCDVGCELV